MQNEWRLITGGALNSRTLDQLMLEISVNIKNKAIVTHIS